MSEPTTAELMVQLREYQMNLAQVNALVLTDPMNPEYLELKKSLIEGITLATSLLQERQATTAGADLARAVSDFEKAPMLRQTVDLVEGIAPPPTGELEPGHRVEARVTELDKGVFWFPGVVQSVNKDDGKFTIRMLAKGDVITVEADDVRRTALSSLKSIPIGDIRPNAKVMAKYALDGKWYAARVDAKVPGGWSVTYTSYSNTEIVPYEYIKAMPKTAEEEIDSEDFNVPEHLRVLPTDTEAEKKRKKKAIKALKNSHRIFTQEKAATDKKASWQQFMSKSGKKRSVAAENPLKRESIFKTPDAYDGKGLWCHHPMSGRGIATDAATKRLSVGTRTPIVKGVKTRTSLPVDAVPRTPARTPRAAASVSKLAVEVDADTPVDTVDNDSTSVTSESAPVPPLTPIHFSKGTCSVKVCCRFRPQNDREAASGKPFCVTIDKDTNKVVMNMSADTSNSFSFDRVFDMDSTQLEVYEFAAKPVVEDAINGFNCTVFVYGQTGSGKTHTMMGQQSSTAASDMNSSTQPSDGIVPRIIAEVFSAIQAAPANMQFTVKVSYVEVYLEKIRDLFDPKKDHLRIREDPRRGVWLEDVTEIFVGSPSEMLTLLYQGNANRAIACTMMNSDSSRSHAVFIITIDAKDKTSEITRSGMLYFVDLAGSELVNKTGAKGSVLEEAKMINKSLSALGNVIRALTENSAHIPYRDSKLTRLLQNSLGGNAKTSLIVTVSPSEFNGSETLSTLRFGQRAKMIQNRPTAHIELGVDQYKLIIKGLEAKIVELRMYIAQLERQLSDKGAMLPIVHVIPEEEPSSSTAVRDEAGEFATTITPSESPIEEIEREIVLAGSSVAAATASADVHSTSTDNRSEISFDDDDDGFTRELVVTLSSSQPRGEGESVPHSEVPERAVSVDSSSGDGFETGPVVSDAEIFAALSEEKHKVVTVDTTMQTDDVGPSASEIMMERKLLRLEEQVTLLEQDKHSAMLNIDELKADALADKERMDELTDELGTKLQEFDRLQQSVFALQARLLEVTRERDAVKSSNKDLELTVEAMNAALSINKARSKPSSFFGRSSMDRMLPVMSVDVTALASAADAAMNPSPASTVTSQDAATAEAVSSPFAGVGASAGTLASKPVSAVDNMVSAVTGALLGPSFAGAPQTPRGISLSVSFGSSPARSVPPSPLVSRSASNTSLPAPPSIDTPVSVALGPRSPVDLCLDVVSVDIRVASLAGNQSSGAPSTEALPPVTSTQSSQRAPTPESFELSPTIASVHVAGESPTSPGTLSALPLAVDTRVANPESVTLDSARGRGAVDHEKCVNDLAAVTSQYLNAKSELAATIASTHSILAMDKNKMKQSLFQAENKVRALQAQLAETYSDRMLLDTEKKRLRGIVENQAESIRSMEASFTEAQGYYRSLLEGAEQRESAAVQECESLRAAVKQLEASVQRLAQQMTPGGDGSVPSIVGTPFAASPMPSTQLFMSPASLPSATGRDERSSKIARPILRG